MISIISLRNIPIAAPRDTIQTETLTAWTLEKIGIGPAIQTPTDPTYKFRQESIHGLVKLKILILQMLEAL